MEEDLNIQYWDERYRQNRMGWDIGYVSTPLKTYIDHIHDKSKRILLPGAGNAYEAEYLYQQGFEHVTVLDWSSYALNNLKKRVPGFPEEQLVAEDFFTHQGAYDLILEQTFFSAIPKSKRMDYVEQMHKLLVKGGKLAGVLFNIPLYEDHPPFGGNKSEYKSLFEKWLTLDVMEPCYNSIPERMGSELFFVARKE